MSSAAMRASLLSAIGTMSSGSPSAFLMSIWSCRKITGTPSQANNALASALASRCGVA
jgi:hypothetical protein